MKTEYIVLNPERNVSLTAFLQPVGGEFSGLSARPAVLILPGGGYHFCSDREADPVAFPYLKAGYHVFILRYSLNEQAQWPNPLDDYEQAMSLIRRNAETWHVAKDRIAVIGFSAGGHLAACAATMSVNRPNAAILGYPVIDGACARDYLPSAPDVIEHVDGNTCPCFVFATRTDNLVPAENALHLINALWAHEIAFESHIYSNGPHGLSTGDASINGQALQPLCQLGQRQHCLAFRCAGRGHAEWPDGARIWRESERQPGKDAESGLHHCVSAGSSGRKSDPGGNSCGASGQANGAAGGSGRDHPSGQPRVPWNGCRKGQAA